MAFLFGENRGMRGTDRQTDGVQRLMRFHTRDAFTVTYIHTAEHYPRMMTYFGLLYFLLLCNCSVFS